jgi:tellurite resistance protein
MAKDLPIFDIILNEEDLNQGVGMISLVDSPAIGVDWIKLSKQAQISFKADKERQMLYGPFLIPNMLIYRQDNINGEYYVRFSKEEIDKIATKFNEDLNSKNINLMHTDTKVDAFVAQNWVIEGQQDKSRNLGFDLPEGSWFGGVKIKDQSFWNEKVKNNEVKGFSVEILADLELSLKNKEQIMENEIKLGTANLKDGITVYWDGEFGMGTAIFMDEALTQPAPDADHVLEDGTIVTTKDGMVVEIQVSSIEEDVTEEDLAVDPNAAPVAASLTAEEVSGMIDARFAELMDEITRLKTSLEEANTEVSEFRKTVNEKFSTTPATTTIAKPEFKMDTKFAKEEARVREFAKNRR